MTLTRVNSEVAREPTPFSRLRNVGRDKDGEIKKAQVEEICSEGSGGGKLRSDVNAD